jgi:hypothetical protein
VKWKAANSEKYSVKKDRNYKIELGDTEDTEKRNNLNGCSLKKMWKHKYLKNTS